MLSSASVQHHLHWGSVTLLRQPTSVLSFIGVLWYLFSYFFLERSGIFSTLFFPSAFPLPYVFPFFLSLFPYPSFLLPFFPAVLSILHICPFIFFALPVLPSLVICFVCFFYAFPFLLSTEAQTLFIVCCQSTALNCSLCFHKLPIPEKQRVSFLAPAPVSSGLGFPRPPQGARCTANTEGTTRRRRQLVSFHL